MGLHHRSLRNDVTPRLSGHRPCGRIGPGIALAQQDAELGWLYDIAGGTDSEAAAALIARWDDGAVWTMGEEALTSTDGRSLARVAGQVSYWFAWDGYEGDVATLYGSNWA